MNISRQIILEKSITIKRDILNLYEDDFKKIDSTGKLSLLFDAIPAQLNKNAARYQVSNVLANDRADSILELIAELKDSKTVLVSYHANDPNAGMSTNKDLCKFKTVPLRHRTFYYIDVQGQRLYRKYNIRKTIK